MLGQLFECWALELEALAVLGIVAPDHLIDELAIGSKVGEVARAAQKQRILNGLLQMAVRTLDRTVLMRDAAVVAGWFHAVVAHELLIAAGEVLLLVAGQVAEGRREAVAAVLFGHGAERPQRVLQALGEGNEALPAEDDVSVLPAAIGQAEVIEQVIERLAGNVNAEIHAGEVGQAQPPGHLLLAEDHVLLRAIVRLPHADAPLQCSAHVAIEVGMSSDDLVKDGDRPYSRCLLEQRHDLALPQLSERIGPAPTAWNVLL